MPSQYNPILPLTQQQVDRFWAKVQKTDGCWLWTGSRSSLGYGQIRINWKLHVAARVAMAIHTGAEPIECVLHKCDNPQCVRPDHLFYGTMQDNSIDAFKKGRLKPPPTTKGHPYYGKPESTPRGEKHWRAKLTEQQVRLIRFEYMIGTDVHTIAQRFGVKVPCVYKILARTRWKHI